MYRTVRHTSHDTVREMRVRDKGTSIGCNAIITSIHRILCQCHEDKLDVKESLVIATVKSSN